MLRALCCLLCLSAIAQAQDPAARCAEALLRGDQDGAAAAVAAVEDPALRARLQAALVPWQQRPAAMLAVAGQFADSAEADAAILAGAAAALALRDRGRAVPELMAWIGQEAGEDDDSDLDQPALGPVVEQLWRALEARVAAAGDAATLGEAQRLLQLCSVSRFGFVPARVLPASAWPLPERREDLLLRAWRRQPGRSSWDEFDRLAKPAVECLLPMAATEALPGLGAGDWLVELASTTTHWRGLRAVEVSDLDVVALVDHGVMALGAWRGGQPADGGEWRLQRRAGETAQAFAGGATVAWPEPAGEAAALLLRSGGASAWTSLPDTREVRDPADHWQAHLMLDRPLYRPGESLFGRVVLRRCRFDGHGLDARADAEAAGMQPLTLRAFANSAHELQRSGRTDAHGVFSFELSLPTDADLGAARFTIEVPGEAEPVTVYQDRYACQIANFRRPVLLLDVAGPEAVQLGYADPKVVLRATWASGAPAAGVAVQAQATSWRQPDGKVVERYNLTTDSAGCATLTVALAHLEPEYVLIRFSVESPDGRSEQLDHQFRVWPAGPRAAAPERSWWDRRRIRVSGPGVATVGVPCRVKVQGPAGARVLLVAGRGHGARAQQLRLDEHGDGSAEVTPVRAEWPALDLAVAMADAHDEARVPMQLRAAAAPRIEVPAQAKPGDDVTCRIATGAAGTVVTVAVVDERIFSIVPDRTGEPDAQLRPYVPSPQWRQAASAGAMAPQQLLGSMLEHGCVPATDYQGDLGRPTPGPSGGAGAAGAGAEDVRADFRATAAFVTVVAGADGTASVPFTLPSDLTTWRVSVVGVAPDGIGFQQRRALVTRLPLAAEPLLPRVLRQGDRVAMQVVVDRAAGATADRDVVHLTADSDGPALVVGGGDVQLPVPAGSARTAAVTLRGVAGGDAALSLAVQLGDHADRSRRAVSVQRDVVARPVTAAAMGSGRVELAAPDGADPQNGLRVVVLGGSSAAWRAIEQRLTAYPYGCVEQTLSRLLPFFAAVRGARAHGAPPPAFDEGFRQRLDAGLRRLRQLQQRRGGGFAFWPRGDVDVGMTALVLHGLAVVRDGGVDPAQYGLGCDPAREPFASACSRLLQLRGAVATAADVGAAELAAACLRSVPETVSARAAVAALVDAGGALPPGLLARTGLALVAAGDRPRAERCLQRLAATAEVAPLTADGFPGDDPLAVRALQLELHCILHAGADVPGDLAGDVLLQCLHGYSSTYAQACALSALALALPPAAAQPFAVQVFAGAAEHRFELTADNGFTARLKLPFAGRCAVVGPAGRQVLLRLVGERTERASDHAAWQAPVVVERDLCRKRPGAPQRRQGDDLEPIGDTPPRVGEALWLRVAVRSPVPMRYVVVECPLPAGFELPDEPWWIERFDDRVAFTFDRLGGEPAWRAFAVVPTMAGTVVWPPAVAAPMYVSGSEGGCAGSVLTVAAAGEGAPEASTATCFAEQPPLGPPASPTAWQQGSAAASALLEAWDATDPAAARAAIEAQFETLLGLAGPDDREVLLDVLTELCDDLRQAQEESSSVEPALLQLRATLLTRAQALQQQLVFTVLGDLEREDPEYTDRYRIETLLPALAIWTDEAARERLLARVLRCARERQLLRGVDLLHDLEGPATGAELRGELLSCLVEASPQVRARILELLPVEDLAGLPPAVLVEAADQPWPDGVVALLLRSASGKAELRRCLRQPMFLYWQLDQLVADLPAELWREIPLAAFAELTAAVDTEDLLTGNGCDLATRLAGSSIPTAALQQELVVTQEVEWRLALALALRQRGIRDLGVAAPALYLRSPADPGVEPSLVWWARALAIGGDEAGAAMQFLVDLRTAPAVKAADGNSLQGFVLPTLVAHGTAAQLAPVSHDLDAAQCEAVFARLDAAGRRALLGAADAWLVALPTPTDLADCQVLWDYGERCDDRCDAVGALCRSDVGAAFVLARIHADREAAAATGVLDAFADAMGLDADTLQAPADEPWSPLLRAVARGGLQRPWAPAEQQQLERMRRLRGVW